MITFEYPPGLLLLLIIPLLLFFVRNRSMPRPRILTALFLLDEMKTTEPAKTFRFFRLKRKHRQSLVALIIAGLAFAISGTALEREENIPEQWLIVIDNIPLGLRVFEGRTVQETIHDFLLEAADNLEKGDSVTVMTTSPSPAVRTFPVGEGLREHLGGITTGREFTGLDKAAGIVADLAGECSRAILLSPRSAAWRRVLGGRKNHEKITIPDDRLSEEGNAGIVRARIRPGGGEGRHDIFLAVMSSDTDTAEAALTATAADGRPLPFPGSVVMEEGRGSFFLEDVDLEGEEVTFSLAGGDAFPPDDAFTFPSAVPVPVKISLTGDSTPVFEAALGSFPLFTIVPASRSEVDVFLGDPPARLDKPSLVVFPTRDRPGLKAREIVDTTDDLLRHPDHPVTVFLPDRGLRPQRVMRYSFDESFESVASVSGVPAILAGELDGHRVVVWAFNPLEKDLFLTPEFVILLRESAGWLAEKPGPGPDFSPGAALTRAGRSVALPEMNEDLFRRKGTRKAAFDLVPLFIAVVLVAGLYLAAADALSDEEGP